MLAETIFEMATAQSIIKFEGNLISQMKDNSLVFHLRYNTALKYYYLVSYSSLKMVLTDIINLGLASSPPGAPLGTLT